MTAVLSPGEVAEVSRFGIHDEDVLRDLEESIDETPMCTGTRCVPLPAIANMICRGCRNSIGLYCAPCLAHDRMLAMLLITGVRCKRCEFTARDLDGLAEVVAL